MFDMIELLGHSGYDLRSSIVLTYGLDLPLYDGLIRRALNRAGVWNQAVFCDLGCYIQDVAAQTAAIHAGKQYSVTPIWEAGAFHPKVYLLLGPKHGRLLVGSGNTTVGGLIRNAEVFGLFDSMPPRRAARIRDFQLSSPLSKSSVSVRPKQCESKLRAPARWRNGFLCLPLMTAAKS